jgi:hypothetical protein
MRWLIAVAVALAINVAIVLTAGGGDDRSERAERRLERAFAQRGAPVSDIDCEGYECTARSAGGGQIACTVSPGGPIRSAVRCDQAPR